ncbi:Major facilitator superfamily domain [Venturia nashicola]|uniref:Very long-chain fatty acid transport protein n=1 Tax=Venturia nashicola TaxID=86259 RepID=A0A4Z1NX13_9PEZI|nr:general substrate transporter [Venturia nashicola]TLD30166.1 Major facilitator superfamily domain [Venturia nashicola]
MSDDVKSDGKSHEIGGRIDSNSSIETGIIIPKDGDAALAFLRDEDTHMVSFTAEQEKALVRKIDWRIMPLMWCCYFLQYLDKTLINYAAVMGLYTDAHIDAAQFSTLALLFYVTYLALEFPHGFLMQKFLTAKYLGLMVTLWGLIVAVTSAAKNWGGLVATRVLLGCFESAVAPSLILITGMWYKRHEQPPRVGFWYLGTGTGTIIGSLISFGFQHYHSSTFTSWQIMFLVVGIITVTVGIIAMFFLPDNPMSSKFMTHDEKVFAIQRLRANQTGIENKHLKLGQVLECFEDPQTWLLSLITVASNVPNGAVSSYQATIIKQFGYSSKETALLQIPSGAVSIVSILIATWAAGRYNQRGLCIVLLLIPGILGGSLMAFLPADNKAGKLMGNYLTNCIGASLPLMYSWVSANFAGHTKKVTMNAILLMSFCLGNIIGPLTFRKDDAPDYVAAKITIIVCCAVACVLAVAAVAGATAVAAYLDAKFHIRKDLRIFYRLSHQRKFVAKEVAADRCCLFYQFEAQVQRIPSDVECLWSRTGSYTWSQTYHQACRYGQFYLSQNVQPRELVATYLTNSPEFLFSQVGLWSIGCAPAMINYHLTGDALIHCVKLSGAKVMVVDWDEELRARIEENRARLEGELGVKIIILDEETRARINALPPTRPDDSLRKGMSIEFPMALIYTSGSTGFPKACVFTMGRAMELGHNRITSTTVQGWPNPDRYYNCMPMYHGTGGVAAVSSLICGITYCIGKKFSASRFWDDIRDSNATAFVYVGETARYLLAAPDTGRDKDHKVRVMFGNGMRPDVWHKFRKRFGIDTVAEFFNSTEGVFGLLNVSRGPFSDAIVGHTGGLFRTYLKDSYVAAEIDHETGNPWRDPKTGFGRRNPLDKGGEILVDLADPKEFPGYWNNDGATESKFVRDLFKKGDLYYRTGDALRMDKDGRWFFLDRLGDTYRWKSENVATAEVSEKLGHHPGLTEAIVYGVAVPGYDGKAGCAAIALAAGQATTPQFFRDLLKYSLEQLPKYAVPVFLRLQQETTAMHNQKQNKVPLKKDGLDLDAIYGVGIDETEARTQGKDIMYWWPGALGHPDPGLDGEGYVVLTRADWEGIVNGGKEVARL